MGSPQDEPEIKFQNAASDIAGVEHRFTILKSVYEIK